MKRQDCRKTSPPHGLRYTAATRVYEVYRSMGMPDRIAWEAVADITGHATMLMAKK